MAWRDNENKVYYIYVRPHCRLNGDDMATGDKKTGNCDSTYCLVLDKDLDGNPWDIVEYPKDAPAKAYGEWKYD